MRMHLLIFYIVVADGSYMQGKHRRFCQCSLNCLKCLGDYLLDLCFSLEIPNMECGWVGGLLPLFIIVKLIYSHRLIFFDVQSSAD